MHGLYNHTLMVVPLLCVNVYVVFISRKKDLLLLTACDLLPERLAEPFCVFTVGVM